MSKCLTVGELREVLKDLRDDMPIVFYYDSAARGVVEKAFLIQNSWAAREKNGTEGTALMLSEDEKYYDEVITREL